VTSVIPFNDLTRLSEPLRSQIRELVGELSVSGKYILGNHVEQFEEQLAQYLKVKFATGVATGTDALTLALTALKVESGDLVLTVSNAGAYTTIAAKSIGAEPVFVDVSRSTLQMTLQDLEKTLEICQAKKLVPKALVVTHLYGQLNSEMGEIVKLARSHKISVIEDCAQALGAKSDAGMAGSFGDIATFSFYPTKNLGASGDGGALATSDLGLNERIKKLRQYGWDEKYHIEISGGRNSRLDEIQAAVLSLKLPLLDDWNQKRREIYARYIRAANENIVFFSNAEDSTFVAHLSIIHPGQVTRQTAQQLFADLAIQTSRHFPVPDHKQNLELKFRDLVPLPVTEWSSEECLTVPLFPELREDEIVRIETALARLES
jgi:dTDP-3-amino-2,3,6-trideoxy-4-keto-D-glucose/dTDP-3-amino-3,4,6-trideoxy-alpha-D-glucose/dTDP-2,6-dideoxy-D-kanosamine transaminase